ncbi:unnamed protein product [Diatraea saccharalis]|uniref:UDP-glucuronosyltransferase n=1 Tax=Diatraea saccharalis TaxID=40085 RepID=A0A9P0C5U6_9NEOP|nr:unnamed protein product [Diatraea saccharalis]
MRVLCFVILISICANEAARIFAIFPTPSISHQVVFRPLVQELVKRNHEVVVVTTDPAFPNGQAPANLTEIDVHEFSYKLWRDKFLEVSSRGDNDIFSQLKVGFKLISKIFGEQMLTTEVQEVIKDTNKIFDLVLVEALARPALALKHVLKVPLIQVSSFGAVTGNYETIGAPVHPILYPTILRQRIYNLTFWEKVTELYNHYRINRFYDSIEESENNMIRNIFGENIPSLSELSYDVDMIFFNMNPIWEGNRPVPPNVIYMGGLHQKPVKQLPQDLKSYLDKSTNGVIYISFGTNVNPSQLPQEKIQILIKVFSQLPYNVLWKWDKDELPGITGNIKISKWFPQSDLLRHPNVKLFITQGGLQSTDEAITAGVPLIGIPMLGDQWFNVEKYTYHKIGKRLDINTITEEKFRDAISTVIGDKSYRENIIRLRTLMRDQPQSPLDRAVWWIEYVIRHGGAKHLRSPAANISWAKYLELEFVGTLLALILSVIMAILLVLYYSIKILRRYIGSVKVKTS